MERLADYQARDGCARDFTAVQALWEFLDPHGALTPYAADYRWLAQVYEASRATKVSDALLWHRLGPKTLVGLLVHGHISAVEVTGSGLEEVVVDAECRPCGRTGPRRETEYSPDLDRLDHTDDADQPPFRRG